jgi:hypothetical protein
MHELTLEQHQLLAETVTKVTDGYTQAEFLRELGVAKGGHSPKGGDLGGRRPKKGHTLPTEEQLQAIARDDAAQLNLVLNASASNFTALLDFEIESQVALLARHLEARRLWLRTAKSARNAQTVQAVVDNNGATLSAAQTGAVISNLGASGAAVFALPAAVAGMNYTFIVEAAQELRIDPNGTETIALPSNGVQGAAGKYLTADAVGENVMLVCATAGTWDVLNYTGTWTAEG